MRERWRAWLAWLDMPARPRWLSLLAGALIALAQPPFGILPGLLGYALLLWALERDLTAAKPLRTVFFMGWLAGFAYFFVGCFWVAEAFLVDAATYGWMAPFAATLLPSGMALFWGLFAVLYRRFRPSGQVRFVYFASLFSLLEMARGMVLSGFPWNPSGATWAAGSAMSQTAAYVGVYGLGFLTVAIFCSVAVVRSGSPSRQGLAGYAPVIGSALCLCGLFVLGEVRLRTTQITYTDYVVRVVQPNVGQKSKWTPSAFDRIFTDYVEMSQQAPAPGKPWPDLIIWPEGALPKSSDDLFAADSWTAPVLVTMLRDQQSLIFGAYRSDVDPVKGLVWRNSLIAVQQHEKVFRIEGYYNKRKLVPFGEFLPYEEILERIGFTELVNIGDGFTPGERTKPVSFGSIPRFLPLICFEGIFPSLDMTDYVSSDNPLRPKWIVNISNDAWFGPTTGPRQHLNLASFRAIEEGLPMVRSTPTGVSGLIDPLGRIVPETRLLPGVRGVRDFTVPHALSITPFSGQRFWFLIFSICICIYLVTFERLAKVIKNNPANR